MFKDIKIGEILGIPLRVDNTVLLSGLLFIWLVGEDITTAGTFLNTVLSINITVEALTGEIVPFVLGSIIVLGVFIGITLHEVGHLLIARQYDIQIESITLWIFGGIARIPDIPRTWNQELFVAIAGPLVSLVLGGISYGALLLVPLQFNMARFLFGYLMLANVVIAGFNLLPGFPLDGGRILRALLTRTFHYLKATLLAVRISKGFAIVLALIGIFSIKILYIGLAVFIYLGAINEARQTLLEDAFQGVTICESMTPITEMTTATPQTSLGGLLEEMDRDDQDSYPVMKNGNLLGIVTIEHIVPLREQRLDARVSQVMNADPDTIPIDNTTVAAFRTLYRNDAKQLPVVDDNDEIVGVLSRAELEQQVGTHPLNQSIDPRVDS